MGKENKRPLKGECIFRIPDEFVAIDTETTGLSPAKDEVIEISAVRYRNGQEIAEYETLVHPSEPVSPFISSLTGITNEMLEDAPSAYDAVSGFLNFVGSSVLVGHNVHFDINFLYDLTERYGMPPLANNFIDTLYVARNKLPGLKSYRLSALVEACGLSGDGFHRAGYDARMTAQVLLHIADNNPVTPAGDGTHNKKKFREHVKVSALCPEYEECDTNNPCYGKVFVFTGELSQYKRRQAMQEVVNRGGSCKSSVTRNTNYLVEGSFEDIDVGVDGESTKQQVARKLQLDGYDIHIIPESVFLDMLV